MPPGFDFDPTILIVSMIPSGIGFVLFTYGKKMHRLPQLLGGIAMMVYPYFTPTLATMASVGTLICALVWFAVQLDW
jgi:hypothetical protein